MFDLLTGIMTREYPEVVRNLMLFKVHALGLRSYNIVELMQSVHPILLKEWCLLKFREA